VKQSGNSELEEEMVLERRGNLLDSEDVTDDDDENEDREDEDYEESSPGVGIGNSVRSRSIDSINSIEDNGDIS
jgi:hypothetical protein